MERPSTGLTLTRPEALLLCVVPGIVIEVFGSAPSLDAAFDLGKYLSWAFAAAISGILILAAEQLGNTLASTAAASRRRAKWTAMALLTIAIAAGVVAVVSLADSRATNLAYQQGGQLHLSEASSDGSFSSGAGAAKPEAPEAAGAFGAKQPAAESPASPDYSFFIPLSILVMATAMLFAYRIEVAHDWNELGQAIDETEGDVEEARKERDAALEEHRRAITPEGEVVVETAADVEREHGLLTLWVARFMAEYHRFCAALGNEPQPLTSPQIPDPAEAVQRMIDPREEGGRRQEGPPPPNGGGGSGGGSNGGGPTSNGGGPTGAEPESEPDPPPPPPPPPPPDRRSDRERRSDRQGRPRRFGGGG